MNIYSFDFDEWASLAKLAPDVFEQRRREYVDNLISECTDEYTDNRRLRGLQCRIDMERIRARTSMKSCLRIYTLMWDSFLDYRDALDNFVHTNSPPAKSFIPPKQKAQILLFKQKN